MDSSTPVGRDWMPTYGWVREGQGFHTRLNVARALMTRERTDAFTIALSLYDGSEEPKWRCELPSFGPDDDFLHIELADVLAQVGSGSVDAILEIEVNTTSRPPQSLQYNESWLEYYNDDGSFAASLPTFALRPIKTVQSYNITLVPGVNESASCSTELLLVNKTCFEARPQLHLFDTDGTLQEGLCPPLPQNSARLVGLTEVLPNARDFLEGTGGLGSLMIVSDKKISTFFLFRSLPTGIVTALDHTTPFWIG